MLSALRPALMRHFQLRCLFLILQLNLLLMTSLGLASTALAQSSAAVLSINAGGGATGNYAADQFVQGGNTDAQTGTINTSGVTNPAPQAVYQSERWGNFTYTLPGLTPSGYYTVRLHFAEVYYGPGMPGGGGAGTRQFNVTVNGTQVLTNFDIFAAAGGADTAIIKAYPATADVNGNITIAFTQGAADNAKISGIEVLAAPAPVPVLTSIAVSPPSPTLNTGGTQQFTAVAKDQNGNVLSPQPAFTWSSSGVGSVSSAGLYTAGTTVGSATVTVASGTGSATVSGTASVTVAAPSTQLLAINAGGGAASPFVADTDYSGGSTDTVTSAITTSGVTNPAPQAVYQSERWGNFTYTLPGLTPGTAYTVRLHLAETYFGPGQPGGGGTGSRQFNVTVNGTQVLSNFDIFAAAGGANIAVVKSYPATADASGTLTVAFTNGAADNAKVSGIEVLAASAPVPVLTSIAVSPPSPTLNTGGTQQFIATAKDQSGNTLSPQPTFTWSSSGFGSVSSAGLYTAGASAGTASVQAKSGVVNGSATVTVNAPPLPTPYGGSAVTVGSSGTAKVEAENYDLGGEGVAYHDLNNGSQTGYRSDNIGVYYNGGVTSNGYAVGWTQLGEWDGYTLNVSAAGTYTLSAAVGSPSGGGTFHLEFGPVGQVGGAGVTQSPEFTFPNTGSYNTFQTVSVSGVSLPAGPLWMRLVIDSGNTCTFDYFTLTPPMPLLTSIAVSPSSTSLSVNGTQQFTATAKDQNGLAMSPQPTFTWSITSGGGTVSTAGLYTAGTTAGNAVVQAAAGNVTATAAVTIASATPLLSAQAVTTYVNGPPASGINLTWTAVTGATQYNLYRSTTSGGEGSVAYKLNVAQNNSGTLYTTYVEVPPSVATYYYQVTEVSAAGEGPKSNEASATVGAPMLTAPILKGVTTGTQNTLTWGAVPNAASYNLYRNNSLYRQGLTSTAFTDLGLTTGTIYTYYLTAVNTSGEGTQSNQVSLTIGAASLPAPLLTAKPSSGPAGGGYAVQLQWPSVSGASSYNLYRSTSAGGEGSVPYVTRIGQSTGTIFYADGVNQSTGQGTLSAGTTYYYQVVAVGPGGEGALSNEASATVGATLLTAPILKGTTSGTQNALTWGVVPNATSYNLYRNNTLYRRGLTGTSFADSGLTAGTAYTYYVTGVNTSGEGIQSNTVSLTPGSAALPATFLTASVQRAPSASSTYILLQWNPVSGAASYNVYRSTSAGGEGAVPFVVGVSGSSSGMVSYSDGINQQTGAGSLPTGTTYYYQVVAVGPGGEGAFSNEASATVGVTPLSAPIGFTATANPNGAVAIALAWNPVANATSYTIFRTPANGSSFSEPIVFGVTGSSYIDTNVVFCTNYTYTVAAVDKDGLGSQSTSATAALIGFVLSATPATLTAARGTMQAVTCTVMPSGGFTGPVTFSGTGLPSGVNAWFYPSSNALAPVNRNSSGQIAEYQAGMLSQGISGSISAGLYLAVPAGATPGTYTLTISASSGGQTNTVPVTVTIQ